MSSSLVRLLGFGVAAACVGGIPGIGIIFTATAVEAAYQRKQKAKAVAIQSVR